MILARKRVRLRTNYTDQNETEFTSSQPMDKLTIAITGEPVLLQVSEEPRTRYEGDEIELDIGTHSLNFRTPIYGFRLRATTAEAFVTFRVYEGGGSDAPDTYTKDVNITLPTDGAKETTLASLLNQAAKETTLAGVAKDSTVAKETTLAARASETTLQGRATQTTQTDLLNQASKESTLKDLQIQEGRTTKIWPTKSGEADAPTLTANAVYSSFLNRQSITGSNLTALTEFLSQARRQLGEPNQKFTIEANCAKRFVTTPGIDAGLFAGYKFTIGRVSVQCHIVAAAGQPANMRFTFQTTGGVTQTTTLDIANDAIFHRLKIVVDETTITYYLDDVQRAQHTNPWPSSDATGFKPTFDHQIGTDVDFDTAGLASDISELLLRWERYV